MRIIITSVLALLVSACGSYNFEPTPAPNEIVKIIYTVQSQSGSKTWDLVNDNLKVTITSKAKNGRVTSNKVTRSNFNNFSLIITGLEKAKFTTLKSQHANFLTQNTETMVIETHAKTYKYDQNSSSRFPKAIQEAAADIVKIFR